MAEGALKRLLSGLRKRPEQEVVAESGDREPPQASFEQVVIRLQQLVEERSFVEVRFPGRSDSAYQSLILKVDPLERYLLIDELFPAHGAFFVTPGDEVEVTSVRRGIPVRFSSWIKAISLDEADGYPAYRLALPDSVEAKQRRKTFRVTVDVETGLKLRIRGPDGERQLCTVQDLSLGGLGFSCQGNLGEMLRANNQLKNSVLSIPGLPDISCDLEVRKFEFRRAPYRHTVVGSRFEGLGSAGEKQVEQFLVMLQRQTRRGTRQN
jgi:c-di-GMP-binding flagellar brake protein YcgR